MRFRLPGLVLAGLLLLAGCASEAEILRAQQEQAEADAFACLEQGFEVDSDSLALCRLLLQTNRRLDALASRLVFLESDLRRLDLLRDYDYPSGRVCRRC